MIERIITMFFPFYGLSMGLVRDDVRYLIKDAIKAFIILFILLKAFELGLALFVVSILMIIIDDC